jgi:hypothetical protein
MGRGRVELWCDGYLEIKMRSECVLGRRGILSRFPQELLGLAQGKPAGPTAFRFGCSIGCRIE